MNELGSRSEIERRKSEAEEQTAEQIEESERHKVEASEAARVLASQEAPAVLETGQDLNRIADDFESSVETESERHESQVVEQTEAERNDVSEPAREGEEGERGAAKELEGAAGDAGRCGEKLVDAAEVRDETAEFLADIAEGSETHQEQSRDEAERLKEEARSAAAAIQRF